MRDKLLVSFPYFRIGGAENLTLSTIKELKKNNVQLKVLTLYIDENFRKEIEPIQDLFILPNKYIEEKLKIRIIRYFFGIPVYIYMHFKHFYNYKKFLCFGSFSTYTVSLINFFIRKKIDIFYFEFDVKIPGKVKFQFSDHYQNFIQFLMLNFQDFFDQIFLKQIRGLIVIDDKNLKYAKLHYSTYIKNFYLVYPMLNFSLINIEEEKVSQKIKDIFKTKSKFLSIVGTLDIKKNTVEALKLLRYLKDRKLDYKLIIVGTGELEEDLKNYTRSNKLEEFVFFTGKANFNELAYIYNEIYCNLFFARNQTWGLTPFEALMFNKPSIVSNEAGCAEFLARHKLNFIYELGSDYSAAITFLEKDCSKFSFKKEKLDELLPDNYINKLLSIIF